MVQPSVVQDAFIIITIDKLYIMDRQLTCVAMNLLGPQRMLQWLMLGEVDADRDSPY